MCYINMEYLKPIRQINDEIARDKRIVNTLFGEIEVEFDETCLDFKDICPICKERKTHRDWWTCKGCAKRTTVEEYTGFLIKHFSQYEHQSNNPVS